MTTTLCMLTTLLASVVTNLVKKAVLLQGKRAMRRVFVYTQ